MSDEKPFAAVPAIRVAMMPRDTNAHGTIFGGVLLAYLDQAGAIVATEAGCQRVVTVVMREVQFVAPVFVGDVVSFFGELVKVGTTSVTVKVLVEARRYQPPHESVRVTEAEIVYVNVGEDRKPKPIRT